jgi:hypothetical protein
MGKKKKEQVVVPDWESKPEERTKFGFYFLLFAIALIPRLLHLLMISDNPFFNFPIIDCQVNDSWGESIAAGQWLGR